MRSRLLRVVLAVIVGVVGTGLVAGPVAAAPANVREAEWHLDALKIPQAQRITKGAGVVVATIDSAVDVTHPDLQGQVLTGTGIGVSSTNGWGSDGSAVHGTGMAGLIAGKGGGNTHMLGIAPAAKILPVAVADDPQSVNMQSVAQGIRWAVNHGAKVINVSMGKVYPPQPYEIEAVRYALSRDVVVVAATGNTSESGVGISTPAIIPGVVAVAGVTQTGWAWGDAGHGPQVVVAAPATNIITTAPRVYSASDFGTGDGTSMATAITSGVIALIRARYPKLNAANVINRLIATAKDNGDPGRDQKFGYGTIRPLDALTANVPTVSANPLLDGASTAPSNSPSVNASSTATGVHRIPRGAVLAIILAVFVALVLLIVILAVRSGRRRRNQRFGYPAAVRGPVGYGAPPPGYPAGYPPVPGGPPAANPWPGAGRAPGTPPWSAPGRAPGTPGVPDASPPWAEGDKR
jgi:type VII secretion-associated serine protease mycosin